MKTHIKRVRLCTCILDSDYDEDGEYRNEYIFKMTMIRKQLSKKTEFKLPEVMVGWI